MTDSLRDRVIAMADDAEYDNAHRTELALAVAAMVAEECALECDDAVCYASAGDDPYNVAVRRCAAAIRALEV